MNYQSLVEKLDKIVSANQCDKALEVAEEQLGRLTTASTDELPHNLLRLLGHINLRLGRYRAARKFFSAALQKEKHVARGLESVAETYLLEGNDKVAQKFYEEIRSLLENATQPSPQDFQAWILAEGNRDQDSQAAKVLGQAAKLYPKDEKFTPRWFVFANKFDGWSSELERVAEAFLKTHPHHPSAATEYLKMLLRRGRLEKAFLTAHQNINVPLKKPALLSYWTAALSGWKNASSSQQAQLRILPEAIVKQHAKLSPEVLFELAKAALKQDGFVGTSFIATTPAKQLAIDLYLVATQSSATLTPEVLRSAHQTALKAKKFEIAEYFQKSITRHFPDCPLQHLMSFDLSLEMGNLEACIEDLSNALEHQEIIEDCVTRLSQLHLIRKERNRSLSLSHCFFHGLPHLTTKKRKLAREYYSTGNLSLLQSLLEKKDAKGTLPVWAEELQDIREKIIQREQAVDSALSANSRLKSLFRLSKKDPITSLPARSVQAIVMEGYGKAGAQKSKQSLKALKDKVASVKSSELDSAPYISRDTEWTLILKQGFQIQEDGLAKLLKNKRPGRSALFSSPYNLEEGMKSDPLTLQAATVALIPTADLQTCQRGTWKETLSVLNARISSQFVPGVLV